MDEKTQKKMRHFSYVQYKAHVIYLELVKIEKDQGLKNILERLAKEEFKHYTFWKKFSVEKEYKISSLLVMWYKVLRLVLGLTFMVRFLERNEEKIILQYKSFAQTVQDKALKKEILQIIKDEEKFEKELISQIKEEKIAFISSIVLGLNDGLIEITGALVGFSFALRDNLVVAVTGAITGLAASLSMASSAYMQAKYEPGKDAKKAAIYTGITYISVVLLLLMPFVVTSTIFNGLELLFGVIVIIITSMSYYTAILFERSFKKQFIQMFVFSIGVAIITFLIGLLLRYLVGVNV